METTMTPGKLLFLLIPVLIWTSMDGLCRDSGEWIRLDSQTQGPVDRPPVLDQRHRILKDGTEVINVTYRIFSFLRTGETIGDQTYDRIFIPGCGPYPETGKPDLPIKSLLIRITAGPGRHLEITDYDRVSMDNILPVPVQPLPMGTAGDPVTEFIKDETVYQGSKPFPPAPVLSVRHLRVRDRDFLEIRLAPVQFIPDRKRIEIMKTIRFRLTLPPAKEGTRIKTNGRDHEKKMMKKVKKACHLFHTRNVMELNSTLITQWRRK